MVHEADKRNPEAVNFRVSSSLKTIRLLRDTITVIALQRYARGTLRSKSLALIFSTNSITQGETLSNTPVASLTPNIWQQKRPPAKADSPFSICNSTYTELQGGGVTELVRWVLLGNYIPVRPWMTRKGLCWLYWCFESPPDDVPHYSYSNNNKGYSTENGKDRIIISHC